MKSDANKGISLIEYDTFLKRVKQVTWSDGKWLKFFYDGSGKLLKRQNSAGDVWEYLGNLIFKNGQPYQLSTPEGRAVYASGEWNYEFEYRDVWNNLRVSFGAEGNQLVSKQASDYDAFGYEFNKVASTPNNYFKYQKQERIEDFGVGIDFFKYRPSDFIIGRFWQIDPLAEKYAYNSPYALQENKFGLGVELEGAEMQPFYPNLQGELYKSVGVNSSTDAQKMGSDLLKSYLKAYATVVAAAAPIEEAILGAVGFVAKEVGLSVKTEGIILKGSGSQKGIIEIGERAKSSKAFDNFNPKEPMDFVFDPSSNRMAVGTRGTNPKGHSNLARSIKADENVVVGGRLKRDSNGTLQTSEWSGHYGINWTENNRKQFSIFLKEQGKVHEHSNKMLFKDGTK